MKKVLQVFIKSIAFISLCVLIVLVTFLNTFKVAAFAAIDDSVQTRYEKTNVYNNLQGSIIGGKEFDIADYPHNSNGKPQIISFVEFCYSYYAEKQADYGLYVYVYNPQDIAFDMATERNKIQFTYGNMSSYSKYTLEFLNYSNEPGYEGRFYKFKVRLSDTQRSNILRTVNESERIYKVSSIELSYKNEVTDYVCAMTYKYKGYALGYGSELAADDTLTCMVDGFDKYLTLDVHSTFFRGKGTNGKEYIQDTLHSVYFSVPNKIIEEYGKMTAVHATWLDAYTAPALVTGNSSHYETMLGHIGENVGTPAQYSDLKFNYAFRAAEELSHTSVGGVSFSGYYCGYNYLSRLAGITVVNNYPALYWLFKAKNGDADTYDVPSEDILDYMARYSAQHGGELVNNRYSKVLFESVADSFTDINIRAEETYSLTSEVISKTFWEKLFGGSHVEEVEEFKNIKAIEAVDYNDVKNLVSEQMCKKYYIDDADYDEFKSYCNIAKAKNETVYLFRYKQSEYFSAEVYEGNWKQKWVLNTGGIAPAPGYVYSFTDDDTNAFVMQQWVQLDFDIIDLTFTKDGVETVIPVVMTPMDIAADGDHPVVTTKDGTNWLAIILGIIIFIVLFILLLKLAPGVLLIIGKVLLFIIMLPFKAIAAIVNAVKKRREKKKSAEKMAPLDTGQSEKNAKPKGLAERMELRRIEKYENKMRKKAKTVTTADLENMSDDEIVELSMYDDSFIKDFYGEDDK